MEKKYLPIGSVCSLKGKNKKIMITGYYSVEYNGNFKIKDYVGCVYPEGMLLPNQIHTFNHVDIEKIDFIGYKNQELESFMNVLDNLTGNYKDKEQEAAQFHKENEMFLTSNSTYSKLLFDENGVVMIAEEVKKDQKNETANWNNIKFDENGYVVSVGNEEEVNNPFYKEFNDQPKKEEQKSKDWNIFKNIEFDENGTVVSAQNNNELNKSTLSKIEFDENGTVISVNEEVEKKEQYKFDENGTLISVGNDKIEEIPLSSNVSVVSEPTKSGIKFDENGTVISVNEELEEKEQYKFDENGTLISVGNDKIEEISSSNSNASVVSEPTKSGIKFDENGTVISVNEEMEEKEQYRFDENGTVI